jgi:hypothetical protein
MSELLSSSSAVHAHQYAWGMEEPEGNAAAVNPVVYGSVSTAGSASSALKWLPYSVPVAAAAGTPVPVRVRSEEETAADALRALRDPAFALDNMACIERLSDIVSSVAATLIKAVADGLSSIQGRPAFERQLVGALDLVHQVLVLLSSFARRHLCLATKIARHTHVTLPADRGVQARVGLVPWLASLLLALPDLLADSSTSTTRSVLAAQRCVAALLRLVVHVLQQGRSLAEDLCGTAVQDASGLGPAVGSVSGVSGTAADLKSTAHELLCPRFTLDSIVHCLPIRESIRQLLRTLPGKCQSSVLAPDVDSAALALASAWETLKILRICIGYGLATDRLSIIGEQLKLSTWLPVNAQESCVSSTPMLVRVCFLWAWADVIAAATVVAGTESAVALAALRGVRSAGRKSKAREPVRTGDAVVDAAEGDNMANTVMKSYAQGAGIEEWDSDEDKKESGEALATDSASSVSQFMEQQSDAVSLCDQVRDSLAQVCTALVNVLRNESANMSARALSTAAICQLIIAYLSPAFHNSAGNRTRPADAGNSLGQLTTSDLSEASLETLFASLPPQYSLVASPALQRGVVDAICNALVEPAMMLITDRPPEAGNICHGPLDAFTSNLASVLAGLIEWMTRLHPEVATQVDVCPLAPFLVVAVRELSQYPIAARADVGLNATILSGGAAWTPSVLPEQCSPASHWPVRRFLALSSAAILSVLQSYEYAFDGDAALCYPSGVLRPAESERGGLGAPYPMAEISSVLALQLARTDAAVALSLVSLGSLRIRSGIDPITLRSALESRTHVLNGFGPLFASFRRPEEYGDNVSFLASLMGIPIAPSSLRSRDTGSAREDDPRTLTLCTEGPYAVRSFARIRAKAVPSAFYATTALGSDKEAFSMDFDSCARLARSQLCLLAVSLPVPLRLPLLPDSPVSFLCLPIQKSLHRLRCFDAFLSMDSSGKIADIRQDGDSPDGTIVEAEGAKLTAYFKWFSSSGILRALLLGFPSDIESIDARVAQWTRLMTASEVLFQFLHTGLARADIFALSGDRDDASADEFGPSELALAFSQCLADISRCIDAIQVSLGTSDPRSCLAIMSCHPRIGGGSTTGGLLLGLVGTLADASIAGPCENFGASAAISLLLSSVDSLGPGMDAAAFVRTSLWNRLAISSAGDSLTFPPAIASVSPLLPFLMEESASSIALVTKQGIPVCVPDTERESIADFVRSLRRQHPVLTTGAEEWRHFGTFASALQRALDNARH